MANVTGRVTVGGIQIIEFDGDPNGVNSAPLGSLGVRSDTGAFVRNTDGVMTWEAVGGDTVSWHLFTNSGAINDIAVDGIVTVDTQTSVGRSDLALVGGVITIPAGAVAIVEGDIGQQNSGSWSDFRVYNEDTAAYIGRPGGNYPTNYTAGSHPASVARAVIDASGGAVDVSVRCEAKGATTNILAQIASIQVMVAG